MLENFFGEEIEKTVFLSAAQMREARPGPVRGKYQGHCHLQYFSAGALRAWGAFGADLSGRL